MNVVQRLDTDVVLKTMFVKMSSDLAMYLDDVRPEFQRGFSYSLEKYSDPYVWRAKYQLNNLSKRYIYKSELRNSKRMEDEFRSKFVRSQETVAINQNLPLPLSSYLVVQEARRIARSILGPFEPDIHMHFCRFGKRAAVGLNYRESYLDKRVEKLTGSREHIRWFKNEVLPKDDLLQRVVKDSLYIETNELALATVPKTWEKLRTILKNTVIGGFHSAGIGDYMVDRLKQNGYHLARRPDKHRAWVRGYSRDLSHVTADLSAASDSFSWPLMNKLFPRSWYTAMKFGAIRQVKVKVGKTERVIQTQSFMTMGMGFTFPAQTIAFLSLLKAIKRLLGLKRGRVSVFGDDLIYPTAMHPYVESVLTDLGFKLNKEKTFVTTPFRETCGADFYDGIDVRPFQPEGRHEVLSGLRALAHLYKIHNGLASRWLEVELPTTFDYLRTEMLRFSKKLHQVPEDYPEISGIRSNVVYDSPIFLQPKLDANGTLLFESLSHKYRLRKVPIQLCYLWETLRGMNRLDLELLDFQDWTRVEDQTTLIWRKVVKKKSRHNKPPKKYKVLQAFVPVKGVLPDIVRGVACSVLLTSSRGLDYI